MFNYVYLCKVYVVKFPGKFHGKSSESWHAGRITRIGPVEPWASADYSICGVVESGLTSEFTNDFNCLGKKSQR